MFVIRSEFSTKLGKYRRKFHSNVVCQGYHYILASKEQLIFHNHLALSRKAAHYSGVGGRMNHLQTNS